MEDLKSVVKAITYLFGTCTALIIVLFAGAYLYNSNPSLFAQKPTIATVWKPKDVEAEFSSGNMPNNVKYGYQLISETPKYMGPMAKDTSMKYAGNNLACMNCHLKAGTQAGSASWIGVTNRYPKFSGRSNKMSTIENRINGCMERSMNGKKLPTGSRAMKAIVAYMEWLGKDMPKEKEKEYKGYAEISLLDTAVNLAEGKSLFAKECMVCHGQNGEGVKLTDSTKGYQYPPLWGADSYNNGAGMHRVITSAEFIKGNMPFGQATWNHPKLTDLEAYNLAGYINSFSRPLKENTQSDYPDKKQKPVSTPYGPWTDPFPPSQHALGPFPPIIKYYKERYQLVKTK